MNLQEIQTKVSKQLITDKRLLETALHALQYVTLNKEELEATLFTIQDTCVNMQSIADQAQCDIEDLPS